jgi:hypothetical protein
MLGPRAMRVLSFVAVLGLLLGVTPRWESHSHAPAEHQHGHHHDGGEGHAAQPGTPQHDTNEADSDAAHGHAYMPVSTAAVPQTAAVASAPERASAEFPSPPARTSAARWPPPYRPPIA